MQTKSLCLRCVVKSQIVLEKSLLFQWNFHLLRKGVKRVCSYSVMTIDADQTKAQFIANIRIKYM